MWPFRTRIAITATENAKRALGVADRVEPAMTITDHQAISAPEDLPPPTVEQEVAAVAAVNTERSVITPPDRYSIITHRETAETMLKGLSGKLTALQDEQRIEAEDFERSQSVRATKIAEVEKLIAAYQAAAKIMLSSDYGKINNDDALPIIKAKPVDPAALSEVGAKIKRTRNAPPKGIAPPPQLGLPQFGDIISTGDGRKLKVVTSRTHNAFEYSLDGQTIHVVSEGSEQLPGVEGPTE